MLSEIQRAIDNYLLCTKLRTVTDLIFIPQENRVVVRRKMGRRGTVIDVSGAASPSEVVDIVRFHPAVY